LGIPVFPGMNKWYNFSWNFCWNR